MFVRTAHWSCKPELQAIALETFKTKAIPILRRQPGLLWAQLQAEPGSNRRIAVTIWESQAAHEECIRGGAMAEITKLFAHMYVDGVPPQGYAWPALHEEIVRKG
jgi:heme-degrading monooxygenase HmoA